MTHDVLRSPRPDKHLPIGDLDGIRTQSIGGWTGQRGAGAYIEPRSVPRTLEHARLHQIAAGNREVAMRTPIVHGVHGIAIAHQTHPPAVTHPDPQRQSGLDVAQGRRAHKPVRPACDSVQV